MRICSSWIAVWSISLVIGLAPQVHAGWGQAKLIGQGNWGAIAVDSTGESHIAYLGQVKDTENWTYTAYDTARARVTSLSVPLNAISTPLVSIAVDSHDQPHVAALTGLNDDLSYLSLNSNEWLPQTVASDLEDGNTPLAIDTQGNPHIAYISRTSYHLTHAFYDGTTWQLEDTGFGMIPTSIKIAKDGTVNIAGGVGAAGVCEASGLNGVWSNNCFDFNNGGTVFLGFGANGSPEAGIYRSRRFSNHARYV